LLKYVEKEIAGEYEGGIVAELALDAASFEG